MILDSQEDLIIGLKKMQSPLIAIFICQKIIVKEN